MEITTQIWLAIGLIVYYTVFQLYDDYSRINTRTNRSNRVIEKLRTEFQVTIRVFRAPRPFGFSSFRAIWLNEKLFRSEKATIFTFHHEHYHLKRKHKLLSLLMRVFIALTPLTGYFLHWSISLVIFLTAAYLMDLLTNSKKGIFEKNANSYAHKMTSTNGNKKEA